MANLRSRAPDTVSGRQSVLASDPCCAGQKQASAAIHWYRRSLSSQEYQQLVSLF
jgi:hypothetical protein